MSHREYASRVCTVRNGPVEQCAGRCELRTHIVARKRELHRIGLEAQARTDTYGAGHAYWNAARNGHLAENRACGCALCYIRVAEDPNPRLCSGKMFDHVRTSEAGNNNWPLEGQHPTYCQGMFLRQGYAAFAVGHANKKSQNHGVGDLEFREIEAGDRRESSVKTECIERVRT